MLTDLNIPGRGSTAPHLPHRGHHRAPNFTGKNLYGPGGPSMNDVKQDAFGDCYFVATLGAVATEKPKAILDAIAYQPHTETFRVRLYNLKGKARHIVVTQAELEDNVKRKGGSYVDNTGKYERTWPAVMETAYAKMFDSNAANGLGEGYQKIIQGGWPADAMMAITGTVGKEVKYVYVALLGKVGSVMLLGAQIAAALAQHKAVTLWSIPETDSRSWLAKLLKLPVEQDGLVDNHVYTVKAIHMTGVDWNVQLRNPWGTNMGVGEGHDSNSAFITVSLTKLVDTQGLQSFRVSD